jgi:hypothetical protein
MFEKKIEKNIYKKKQKHFSLSLSLSPFLLFQPASEQA